MSQDDFGAFHDPSPDFIEQLISGRDSFWSDDSDSAAGPDVLHPLELAPSRAEKLAALSRFSRLSRRPIEHWYSGFLGFRKGTPVEGKDGLFEVSSTVTRPFRALGIQTFGATEDSLIHELRFGADIQLAGETPIAASFFECRRSFQALLEELDKEPLERSPSLVVKNEHARRHEAFGYDVPRSLIADFLPHYQELIVPSIQPGVPITLRYSGPLTAIVVWGLSITQR